MNNDDRTLYSRHDDEMDDFGDSDYGNAVPEDHFDEEEEESLSGEDADELGEGHAPTAPAMTPAPSASAPAHAAPAKAAPKKKVAKKAAKKKPVIKKKTKKK